MPQHIVNSFINGEIAPAFYGRFNTELYASAAKKIENAVVESSGAVKIIPGTYFLTNTAGNDHARLVPFQTSATAAVMFEITSGVLRIIEDDEVKQWHTFTLDTAPSPADFAPGATLTGATSGATCVVQEKTSGTVYQCTDFSATAFDAGEDITDGTNTATGASGFPTKSAAADFELTVPWTGDEIFELDYAQPNDSIYFTHPSHQMRKITYQSNGAFVLATVTVTAYSGQDFSTTDNYPRFVKVYESRLIIGPTNDEPFTIWGSVPFSLEDFSEGTADDDAWSHIMSASERADIQWMMGKNALFIGTTVGPHKIGGIDSLLTPSTIFAAKRQSNFSCSDIPPLMAGESIFYLQRGGKAVRRIHYSQEGETYMTPDISKVAKHLFSSKIVRWAFQSEPENYLYLVREDGKLLVLSLDETMGLMAWSQVDMSGDVVDVVVTKTGIEERVWVQVKRTIDNAIEYHVEYFDSITPKESVEDYHFLWAGKKWEAGDEVVISDITQADPAVVTSTAHGLAEDTYIRITEVSGMTQVNDRIFQVKNVTTNTFELYNTDGSEHDATAHDAYSSDGKATPVIQSLTGLDHIEQEDVMVFADGANVETVNPLGGAATLSSWYNKIHAGLYYQAEVELLPFGPFLDRMSIISEMFVHVADSAAIAFVDHKGEEQIVDFREATDLMDTPVPLYTGTKRVNFPGQHTYQPSLVVRSSGSLPFTLLAVDVFLDVRK